MKFIQCLTQVASAWLDPHYSLRQQAIEFAAQEFCLSQPSFELALDWIFSQWTERRIAEECSSNLFTDRVYAAQVLAGNTPAMIAQGLLQGAILGIPQCIKLPSGQAKFARLLHQSFGENSAELAKLFELNTWQDDLFSFYSKLKQADLVIAYGQDETIATLKEHIAQDAIFITHGHAESAAVILKEAANFDSLEKLAYDMLSYDQRGCLSPRVTYIEQGGDLSPSACAKIFSEEILPEMAQKLPRGGVFPGESAEILHQRIVYGFRGQVYCGDDWTVCYNENYSWPVQTLPRFMIITPFETLEKLIDSLKPVKTHLICIGYAGFEKNLKALMKDSTTRFCPVGNMQQQLLIF